MPEDLEEREVENPKQDGEKETNKPRTLLQMIQDQARNNDRKKQKIYDEVIAW